MRRVVIIEERLNEVQQQLHDAEAAGQRLRSMQLHSATWRSLSSWMFFLQDDYDGYKEVKNALRGSGVMLTSAEHEYTRYGFKQLIQSRCLVRTVTSTIGIHSHLPLRRISCSLIFLGLEVLQRPGALLPWPLHMMCL